MSQNPPQSPSSAAGAALAEIIDARNLSLTVQDSILQLLQPLIAINAPQSQHGARMRELSLAITNIQQGVLWLAQYRRELEEKAAAARQLLTAPVEE